LIDALNLWWKQAVNLPRVININDYRVRLLQPPLPYRGKEVLAVRPNVAGDLADPGWLSVAALGKDFFLPAFSKRNPFNIPGPFYGAETDTCHTGPHEAPGNILLDLNEAKLPLIGGRIS
jgi:hypothetical protein